MNLSPASLLLPAALVALACGKPSAPEAAPTAEGARAAAHHEGHTEGAAHHGGDHAAPVAHGDHAAHGGAALPAGKPLPGASLYQLPSTWTDQEGKPFALSQVRGHPTVVLMFYGTCQSVCPVLIEDVLRTDAALSEAARKETRYLLVSFDPSVDTPEKLRALATERGMDTARFHLLHGSDDAVRELATALGVQYRSLGGGHFAHSSVLNLLDQNGVYRAQTEGVAQPVEPLAKEITALLGS